MVRRRSLRYRRRLSGTGKRIVEIPAGVDAGRSEVRGPASERRETRRGFGSQKQGLCSCGSECKHAQISREVVEHCGIRSKAALRLYDAKDGAADEFVSAPDPSEGIHGPR